MVGRGALLQGFIAVLGAVLAVQSAHAQKWMRLAPFPEPAEELVGAAGADCARCRGL